LRAKKILELTGDSGQLNRYYELLVDDWYVNNLFSLPPHTEEIAKDLKANQLEALKKNKSLLVKLEKGLWEGYQPRVRVVITGEAFNIASDLETLQAFIALEADPVRRTALIELAMAKKNIDVAALPKSPPVQMQPPQQAQTAPPQKEGLARRYGSQE
jgi:uracil-DNA glycosylase